MTIATNLDWKTLYSSRQKSRWQLPEIIQPNKEDGIFRDLHLNWNDELTQLKNDDDVPMWQLCCDVLTIDKDIVLNQSAFIFARRIELVGDVSIILSRMDGNTQDLVAFPQEVVDQTTGAARALTVTLVGDDEVEQQWQFNPQEQAKDGFIWDANKSRPEMVSVEALDPQWLLAGEPLRLALMTSFQVATLLCQKYPDLSISQLQWLATIASSSEHTKDLAAQASSFALTLQAIKAAGGDALLVPQLDLDIYAEKAKSCLTLLSRRQEQFETYQALIASGENWLNQAKDALSTQDIEKDLQLKLEKQAKNSRDQVVYARDVAALQLNNAQVLVTERKFQFDAGINIYQREKTIEASFDIVIGVSKILAQLPVIIATGPQMAVMPAIEAGAAFFEVAEASVSAIMSSSTRQSETANKASAQPKEVAEVDEKVKKQRQDEQDSLKQGLQTAGEGAKQIYDAATNIMKISANAEKMASDSNLLLKVSADTTDSSFSNYDAQGLDLVTGGEQAWQLLDNAVDDLFDSIAILSEVQGGRAYRLAIKNLIVYGKTLCQTRLAMAKANGELAEMTMHRISAEKMVHIYQARLGQLGEQREQNETISQLIFGRVLDAKRAIYLTLDAYHRAFAYFALVDDSEMPVIPSLTASVNEFETIMAQMTSNELKLNALIETTGRIPQSMDQTYQLDDADILTQLRENGFATWQLDPEAVEFRNFGRIRFNRVRIYAQGLASKDNIEVKIATSGSYLDKVPGQKGMTRKFISMATRRNFVYNDYDGNEAKDISFDGDIAPRYENDFFQPTPFTFWTVKIGRQDGKAIDLSKITALTIEFSGEATPN